MRAKKERAKNQRAWISIGYPSRGVHAGWLVSIQVKWTELKIRPDSGSIRIPLGVPAIMERPIERRIWRTVRLPHFSSRKSSLPSALTRSEDATKNQSGASDVSRFAGSLPSIIFGRVPSISNCPNCFKIVRASSVLPAAIKPRAKISASRPQSRNQGYPAITVFKAPLFTT